MDIITLVLGSVETNCYILADQKTKAALVVDPADEAEKILNRLATEGLTLKAILLTHGHFDHIFAVNELRKRTGVKVYALAEEKALLETPDLNCSKMVRKPESVVPDVLLMDQETLLIEGFSIQVLATPGHTSGSVCFYFEQARSLFVGDTLFFESIGRTDLPTGNEQTLLASIQEKIFSLPGDVSVYPGHGPTTSVSYEKKHNPYTDGRTFCV